MGDHADWKALPEELLIVIAGKLNYLDDFTRFSVTCKSWNSAASKLESKLPFKHPWLFLAEDTGLDLSAVKVSLLEATGWQIPWFNNGRDFGDAQTAEIDRIIEYSVADLFKCFSGVRGLFSLATQKVYNIDLPEATDKYILGTNKGWLVTLGKDLEINLLHPLLREQIPLPSMLTLPIQDEYDDDFPPQCVYDRILIKVVMSSEVPRKRSSRNQDTDQLPVIMTIYKNGVLAWARLGDESWTNVETYGNLFHNVVYHKERFYAITFHGEVYMCDIANDQQECILVTSIPFEKKGWDPCYLIESLCRSHIWVVLRIRKTAGGGPIAGELEYYTSNFLIFKLELHYTDAAKTLCTWTEVKDLGNEALFIGRTSSTSIASSEFIKPNSIYYTDDYHDRFIAMEAGGHDMGIFNVETGKIHPLFPGISLHPFSPPLWYI